MMKLRLQNPDPFTSADYLALTRRQGREKDTVRHWKSELKKFRAMASPKTKLNFKECSKI